MIVVADTSPINYLILIDQIAVLAAIYDRVFIPHAVHDELLAHAAPPLVRSWAKNPPQWLELASPSTLSTQLQKPLDPGETEAISLAVQMHAEWLLIDEIDGREEAARIGLRTIGALGILLESHRRGLLELPSNLARLRSAGFYASDHLIRQILDLARR
jgi:predicted nucleic acid-binding protein